MSGQEIKKHCHSNLFRRVTEIKKTWKIDGLWKLRTPDEDQKWWLLNYLSHFFPAFMLWLPWSCVQHNQSIQWFPKSFCIQVPSRLNLSCGAFLFPALTWLYLRKILVNNMNRRKANLENSVLDSSPFVWFGWKLKISWVEKFLSAPHIHWNRLKFGLFFDGEMFRVVKLGLQSINYAMNSLIDQLSFQHAREWLHVEFLD